MIAPEPPDMVHHAAIFYHPEGYVTTGQALMGQQAAGEGFLRAAAQSGASRLVCHTDGSASAKHFADQLVRHGFRGEVGWIPAGQTGSLAEAGCLYLPGPSLADFAWRRAAINESSHSLCGITHTTATHWAMSAITNSILAPVRSWDALICTSTVVRDTVRFLFERQIEYLRQRFGAARIEVPQLPVIPLGVHCKDYVFADGERAVARDSFRLQTDEVAILFVGRLSFHSKAHPLQMYSALERAAKGRKIRLIQCGWFANSSIEAAFADAAAELCPSIAVEYLDGRDATARRRAWAAADIFISLSDNIQETFGLTPIEAMAAGIPVIVSDWNGYKDTVRHDVDGFRIPTLTPAAPHGSDLAQRYETGQDSYDFYCGVASQFTALDPEALEKACDRLISDAGLRERMGKAGQLRAREAYDWPLVYRRYQSLWQELAELRRSAAPNSSFLPLNRPDRPDPFAAFATYPTTLLRQDHMVRLSPDGRALLSEHRRLAMNAFAAHFHVDEADCERIFDLLEKEGACTVGQIAAAFPEHRRHLIERGLVWLAKMEAVHITRSE